MYKHATKIALATAIFFALLAAYERGKKVGIDLTVSLYKSHGYPG
jgi:hypothetical protein